METNIVISFLRSFGAAVGVLVFGDCSGEHWDLMPTPLVHQYLGAETYRNIDPERGSQNLAILYATNRPATGPAEAREYANGIDSEIHLGTAVVRIGEPGQRRGSILDASTHQEYREELPLELEATREIDSLPATRGRAFAAQSAPALATLIAFLVNLAKKDKLDVVSMQYSTGERPVDFKAHGHWYLNPWVSSDVMIQFLFNLSPAERGLVQKSQEPIWYFPADYPDRLKAVVDEAQRKAAWKRS